MPVPKVIKTRTTAQSKWFQIETVTVAYNNEQQIPLERIRTPLKQAVIIAPIFDNHFILAREFMVGNEKMGLTFPKGKVDLGETPLQAAHREMREEIGYDANELHLLKVVDSMPGYIQHETHLFLAQDLYLNPLNSGDEPDALEQQPWKVDDYRHLLNNAAFTDARNVATLMLAMAHLNNH